MTVIDTVGNFLANKSSDTVAKPIDRTGWVPVDYAAKLAQAKPVPVKKKDS